MLFATRLRCRKSCLLLIRDHTRFQTTGTCVNRLEQVQKHTDSLPLSVTTHTHKYTDRDPRGGPVARTTRSSRSSLCLSCHHTKMKRSQRPRAFTVRVVPNKSCHRHRRQLSPCARRRCSCHQTKNYFPSSSCSPASPRNPALSVYGGVSVAKSRGHPGRSHIKAHCASINDTGLNLLCSSQSPYISTTRHIYIYISSLNQKKKHPYYFRNKHAKGCPAKCERPTPAL